MAPTGRRQRQVVAATALLVLAGAAGCTGSREEPAPTPAGTTPPAGTSTPRTDPAGTVQEFPSEPQEYAELTVAAWAAPDLLRLAELAVADVHDTLVELPGPPDLTWRFIRCAVDPEAGASDCAFHNLDGDRLVLTVVHERLGGPRAVDAADYQVTSYPDDPLAYLREFVAAWQDGNLARMENLAAPGAVEVYAQLPPPPAVEYEVREPDGPLAEVVVRSATGETVVTTVSTALLGEPQAIRTASLDPASG